MDAGRLRHAGALQEPEETVAVSGERVVNWKTLIPEWRCGIEPLSGREFWGARQAGSAVTHRIHAHWQPAPLIHPGMRLVIGSRVLNFESVINVDERNQDLLIMATETAGASV
jgi:head-tail adaptor